jgi:DNA helicase-2/ATP-dependent DNA helicase PcrA
MKHYLEELNPKQKEAVEKTHGPVLIVAGAGAGKTKTITHRIFHLIKTGVAPENILAITFTNKAAREMRDRVETLMKGEEDTKKLFLEYRRPFMSTFHSLGVHILKQNAHKIGLSKFFSIYDKSDGKRIIKEALISKNYDPKQIDPARIQHIISKEKGNFVTAEEYRDKISSDYFPQIVSTIWLEYERVLRKEKALDLDDLLLITAKLLEKDPGILSRYQEIWKYIHIDEYQDTNQVQYQIAKLLANKYKNLCVVGDTDQNIYSWRGADIKNILRFEKDYPDAEVILLEQNYRSTQTILAVANDVIKKNALRIEKNLFTKNSVGDKIGLYEAYNEMYEAEFVAQKAEGLIKSGISPKEIAVLYRANFQSRALEEAFLSHNIPYQMVGVRFYERKEIKDILSCIRAALNTESVSDIKRIINIPPRGIGKVTLQKIIDGKISELPPNTRKKVEEFYIFLARIKKSVGELKTSDLIKFVMKHSGIEKMYSTGTEEDNERLENIMELVTMGSRYDVFSPEEGIEKLLSDAALASDQDSLVEEADSVKLMTVHAAKGLEFDYVFITGLEDDLFPHRKMNESNVNQEESEEERRLFYVALTRARKKIYLCFAGVRTIFGQKQVNMPSEFLSDVDEMHIEKEIFNGNFEDPPKPLFKIEF